MGFRSNEPHEASTRIEGRNGCVTLRVVRLDNGRRLLIGRPEGYMTREEIRSVMEQIVREPILGSALPTLWDFRGHDFSQYTPPEFRAHAFLMQKFPERIGVRRGYLVDSSTGYGTLRMFQGTASGFNFEQQDNLKVSYDYDELVEWLTAET